MIDAIQKLLAPLRTRIVNMVARAVLDLVDDSTKIQMVQISLLTDETREGVERFQNYGFTSVPKSGAEVAAVFVGGRRDHGLVIAVDDRRYRLRNLESGEVALYDDLGSKVVLKRNGDIEISPQSGQVTVIGDVVADGVSLKSHTHGYTTPFDSNGDTPPAIGGPS